MGGEATVLLITAPAMLEEFLRDYNAARPGEGRNAVADEYGMRFLPDGGPSAG